MGTQTIQRLFRGGEFVPTMPRSGSEGDGVWRVENMSRRGVPGHRYWEVINGPLALNETAPLVALTGTIAVTEGSTMIVGTGTLFLTELHLGQRVIIIDEDGNQTIPIFVKRIISDTSYECWRPSTATLSGQTGWRMYRLFAMNQDRAMLLWGNAIKLDRGSILVVGDGDLRINGAVFSGTQQVETATVVGTIDPAGAGDVETVVTAAGMTGSPKTILTAVANNDTASQVAGKIRTDLAADVDIAAFFTVSGTGAEIVLTRLVAAANDATMNIATDNDSSTGLTAQPTSENTVAGISDANAVLSATREPQIAIYNPLSGTYAHYTLGMNTPTAPTLAAVGGGTKGMQGGNYSGIIYPARNETVGYNNPSPRADVTITTGDKIRVTFPAMDTTNGQNAWLYHGTMFSQSLGADLQYLNGPWRFVIKVTDADVNPAGGTFDIEYLDGEIVGNEIASFDNDAPPQGEFFELLNFNPVLLSCRGPSFSRAGVETTDPSPGPFIAPSKPRNIEAFPVGIQFSSSPPETIIGGVSALGRIYLLTPNTLQIAQATPNDTVPILIRPFWRDGFANPEAVVFENGNLYAFTLGGPARSRGDGDVIDAEKDWAASMTEFTDQWIPEAGHVMTAYWPGRDAICYFHVCDSLNDQGFWTTFVLVYGLAQRELIGTARISQEDRDSIVCGVATVGEKLHFLMGGRRLG